MILLPHNQKYKIGKYYLKYTITSRYEDTKTKQHYCIFQYNSIFTTLIISEEYIFHTGTDVYNESLIYELTEDEVFNNITMVEIVENL